MPKVYITEDKRASGRLAKWVYGELKSRKITISKLADEMGFTTQNVSKKLRNESFSYPDFVFFVRKFQPDNDTINYIIGKE